jgi:hypothetical protein
MLVVTKITFIAIIFSYGIQLAAFGMGGITS